MKFTVVFATHENIDLAYGLLFVPGPVWVRGNQEIVRPPADKKDYTRSTAGLLIDKEQVLRSLAEGQRFCTIVVHPTGRGGLRDLLSLVKELRDEGFTVTVITPNGFEPYDFTVSLL